MTKFDLLAHRFADDARYSMTSQTVRDDDGNIMLRISFEVAVAPSDLAVMLSSHGFSESEVMA